MKFKYKINWSNLPFTSAALLSAGVVALIMRYGWGLGAVDFIWLWCGIGITFAVLSNEVWPLWVVDAEWDDVQD